MKCKFIIGVILLLVVSGCTSRSTQLAIENYERTLAYHTEVFESSVRIATQQLFLSTAQHIRSLDDKEAIQSALLASFMARQTLENIRVDFYRVSMLSRLTVGHYLYDRQGVLNVLLESATGHFEQLVAALEAASATEPEALEAGVDALMNFLEELPDEE